ncbi:hypothetical protein [Saccharomonospora viridis]|uniref:Uncharacterized protein n=1 Tax=Saccharomonospora viridis TaxID=1852 RepID=A0A837D8W5_9PSEU|nr:hypothetical protein [Saccharomonospora viridis]KHF43645.1 hypothetical protein MINT15_23700 [Saccharomonospora viridis]SFP86842.1 hypothetical protein SAMN02982918_3693 [Saccharomonospora viridis]
MSRPTRAEQRRARWALLTQAVTVLLALAAVSMTRRPEDARPQQRTARPTNLRRG